VAGKGLYCFFGFPVSWFFNGCHNSCIVCELGTIVVLVLISVLVSVFEVLLDIEFVVQD
jgi:hypothetical protein